jgi:catecholate siderophore receptor
MNGSAVVAGVQPLHREKKMQTIRSRKHNQVRLPHPMSTALAALLLPIAAQASDTSASGLAVANANKAETVRIVGNRGNDFKADHASSPKYTEALVDTAQSVQVIKKELIEQQGAVSLSEALRNTPGVGAFFLGENGSTTTGDAIFMRGFDTSGSIFVDGVRDVGSIARDTFNIEQIDVLKGPAGTDNGRGAPTGSVNLVTKQPGLRDALSASASIGSGSQRRLTSDYNKVLDAGRGVALRMNAMVLDSGNPARDAVHNKRWAVAPSVAFGLKGPTRVYFNYLHVDQDNLPDGGVSTIGLPGYATPDPKRPFLSDAAPVDPRNFYGSDQDFDEVRADMATVRIEHDFSPAFKLINTARYGTTSQAYLLSAFMATSANLVTPNPADPSTWTLARTNRTVKDQQNKILANQTTLTADFDTGTVKHTLVMGLELASEGQVSYGLNGSGALPAATLYRPASKVPVAGLNLVRNGVFNDATIDTQSLYAFDTVKLGERWIFNGGLRLDHYRGGYSAAALSTAAAQPRLPVGTLVPSHFTVSDTLVNGKLSALYKPTKNSSVYALVASSKQPPGANFTVSSAANNAANPIYDPQQTTSAELGAKMDLLKQKVSLSAALFRTDVKNEVEQDPVDLLYYQTGKKRVQGIELGVTGQFARNWLVSAGYTRMATSVESGKVVTASGVNNLSYTPKQAFTAWTSYTLPAGLKIGGGARFNDRLLRGTDGAVGTPAYADSYWVFDAMAAYQVSRNLELRLNLYNLTDKVYVAAINKSGYRYVPGTPRAASLTATVSF